jgi:predicted RNA-binding protein YlqC (UPF0109 family)
MNDNEMDQELRERRQHWRMGGELPPDDSDLEMYFRDLVSAYLNFPDNLKLEFKKTTEYRGTWALMLEPDVSDYALVAGKRGRNFNALRTLVTQIGLYQGYTIELSLDGPPLEDTSYIRKQLPYRLNPQWLPDQIKSLVSRTLRLAGYGHVRVLFKKNRLINEDNPFDDQTFYWFIAMRSPKQEEFCFALGQLMESIASRQGQRLIPNPEVKPELVALEKTA